MWAGDGIAEEITTLLEVNRNVGWLESRSRFPALSLSCAISSNHNQPTNVILADHTENIPAYVLRVSQLFKK